MISIVKSLFEQDLNTVRQDLLRRRLTSISSPSMVSPASVAPASVAPTSLDPHVVVPDDTKPVTAEAWGKGFRKLAKTAVENK